MDKKITINVTIDDLMRENDKLNVDLKALERIYRHVMEAMLQPKYIVKCRDFKINLN